MTLQEAVNKIEQAMPSILKKYLARSRDDMLTYIDLEFEKPSASALFRTAKMKSLKPNTGDHLRLVSGDLIASYDPKNKKISASKVQIRNNIVEETYQSKLPYAAVHELGGEHIKPRPYLKPALMEYSKSDAERKEFLVNEIAKIFNK